jgi:hypothetical protein
LKHYFFPEGRTVLSALSFKNMTQLLEKRKVFFQLIYFPTCQSHTEEEAGRQGRERIPLIRITAFRRTQ